MNTAGMVVTVGLPESRPKNIVTESGDEVSLHRSYYFPANPE